MYIAPALTYDAVASNTVSVAELIERGAHEGCLADAVLADEQDGAARRPR